MHVLLLILLVVWCVGPLLLLAKFAITPTQDILRTPLAIFPNGVKWSNLHDAWFDIDISKYFVNTVVLAAGSWASQMLVATTGGFVLSVLRPRWARYAQGLVLATLFVPAVVLLVPLYLIILHPPLVDHSLVNSYWAVWLPAGASAFNVVLVAAVLRQPAARDLRGRPRRRRRTVPAVLVDRAAHEQADPRRGVRVRGHRVLEGLPLAAAGPAQPGPAAAVRPAAVARGDHRQGHAHGRLRDRDASSRSSCSWSSSACSCAAPGSGEPSRAERPQRSPVPTPGGAGRRRASARFLTTRLDNLTGRAGRSPRGRRAAGAMIGRWPLTPP